MTFAVYQHWDPLKTCVVGRSHPPEFYSWITVPHVRSLFERIAEETEEDYQNLIALLHRFNVQTVRPNLPDTPWIRDNWRAVPPMCPRDHMVMIGETFYNNYVFNFGKHYTAMRKEDWPDCASLEEFYQLPKEIQDHCDQHYGFTNQVRAMQCYQPVIDLVTAQGNQIKNNFHSQINGAMVARIGKDLFFGTESYFTDTAALQTLVDSEFVDTRNHVINTGGHSDGTYCPVAPGLIISLKDVPTYAETFPGWEVVYLPNQSWEQVRPFMELKQKNQGRWWIPGFEHDQDVVDVVETWMKHWTGYVEETVFDVNMLIINPTNVAVFNYNKQVFDALERFGITPHVVPFRHRYFWDGGLHCVTADLDREGTVKDFFPGR